MPPTAPSDEAPVVDPPQIRGVVLRLYQVATVEDVDYYLRGLAKWLAAAIERAPEFSPDYLDRYNTDVDRLLEERLRLVGLGG